MPPWDSWFGAPWFEIAGLIGLMSLGVSLVGLLASSGEAFAYVVALGASCYLVYVTLLPEEIAEGTGFVVGYCTLAISISGMIAWPIAASRMRRPSNDGRSAPQ